MRRRQQEPIPDECCGRQYGVFAFIKSCAHAACPKVPQQSHSKTVEPVTGIVQSAGAPTVGRYGQDTEYSWFATKRTSDLASHHVHNRDPSVNASSEEKATVR